MRNGAKTKFARALRREMTEAETLLWYHLRRRQLAGLRFRRQHPIGVYIVDFVCLEKRVIVELDGSQHLDSPTDAEREAWLRSQGFHVLRFWNDDVVRGTEDVLAAILERTGSAMNTGKKPEPPGRTNSGTMAPTS